MKYIISSDYHLSESNRLEDTLKNLKVIEDVSKKEKFDYYLNLGDFSPSFRKYFTPLEAKILSNHISNIQAKKKIAVEANHDKVNKDLTTVDWIQGMQIVSTLNITEPSGLKIHGAHRTVSEAEMSSGIKLINHISYKELYKQTKADIILLGHIHKAQILCKKNPLCLIVGSIERINFGERNEDKCFWTLKTNKDKSYELTKHKLKTRIMKYFKIDLDANKIWCNDELTKTIDVKDAVVKVDIVGKKEVIAKINYQKLMEKFKCCYKIKTPVNFIYSDTEAFKDKKEKKISINDEDILEDYCKLNEISEQVKKFSKRVITG